MQKKEYQNLVKTLKKLIKKYEHGELTEAELTKESLLIITCMQDIMPLNLKKKNILSSQASIPCRKTKLFGLQPSHQDSHISSTMELDMDPKTAIKLMELAYDDTTPRLSLTSDSLTMVTHDDPIEVNETQPSLLSLDAKKEDLPTDSYPSSNNDQHTESSKPERPLRFMETINNQEFDGLILEEEEKK